jgi:hypothetical protein
MGIVNRHDLPPTYAGLDLGAWSKLAGKRGGFIGHEKSLLPLSKARCGNLWVIVNCPAYFSSMLFPSQAHWEQK